VFIRYDDGSLIMVTGVAAPVYQEARRSTISHEAAASTWNVSIWMGGNKEIHRMEAEMDARHLFDNFSAHITGSEVFTPAEWNDLLAVSTRVDSEGESHFVEEG